MHQDYLKALYQVRTTINIFPTDGCVKQLIPTLPC